MRPGKKLTLGFLPSLLCLLAMLVAACGSTPSGPTGPTSTHTKAPQNRQVYISGGEAGISDFKTLDPALVSDALSNTVVQDIFTGLVQLNDKLEVIDQLAASHQISSDGTTYTFTLRPNLKFSDGTPLTSQDVVYSINRALDPATKSPVGPYYLHYIKDSDKFEAGKLKTLIGDSLLAPDPNTVVIKTDKVYSFFLDALTYVCSFVVEKKVIDQWGVKWTDHLADNGGQGGAGPFKMLQYTHGKEADVVPNPNYYGPKPQLAEVKYPIYQQAPTVYQAYLANQVDDSYVPTAQNDSAKNRPDYHKVPILAINYYTMSYTKKPFDNIKIRQAFALAINKDLIVHTIWKDTFIATNHIVPQGMPGYNPNLTGPDGVKGTAGDPTLAKQLFQQGMQEEGYTSVSQIPPITLTFSSGGDPSVKNEVAAMQQMWQTVLGVTVKTNDIDINTLFQDEGLGSNNPLMFYTGPAWLTDYPDPQDWTSLQFCKGCGQNGMNYGQNNSTDAAQQQATQQLLAQADAAPVGPARLAMYNQAEQQLVNDVAWLPMEQQISVFLRKPCVQGTTDNSALLTPPDDWANIYISTDTPCVNATVS